MRILAQLLDAWARAPRLGLLAVVLALAHLLAFLIIVLAGRGFEVMVSLDSEEYLRLAAYPLTDGIYSLDGISPSGKREPGYSAFIMLFMILGIVKPHVITVANLWPVIVAQIALQAFASWSVARAAERLYGRLVGLVCLVILQVTPICAMQYTLRNECLTMCLLGLMWSDMALRWRPGVSLGGIALPALWLGIVCLTRSVNFLFVPVLSLHAWWRLRTGMPKAVLFVVLALLPSAAWTVRNYQVFKLPIAGSIDGFSSLYRSNILPYQQISSPDAPEMPEEAKRAMAASKDDAEKYQWFKKAALDWVKANPVQYVKQSLWRAAGMLIDLYREDKIAWWAYPFLLLIGNDQLFLTALLVLCLPMLIRRRDFWIESTVLFFLFTLGIYSAVYGVERYLFPAMYVLGPVYALCIVHLARPWLRRHAPAVLPD